MPAHIQFLCTSSFLIMGCAFLLRVVLGNWLMIFCHDIAPIHMNSSLSSILQGRHVYCSIICWISHMFSTYYFIYSLLNIISFLMELSLFINLFVIDRVLWINWKGRIRLWNLNFLRLSKIVQIQSTSCGKLNRSVLNSSLVFRGVYSSL